MNRETTISIATKRHRRLKRDTVRIPVSGDLGLRWQSAAATPLSHGTPDFQSGVAIRFLPQCMTILCLLCLFVAT